MKPISAIIIDDETHNRNVLTTLLNKHCSFVKVIAEASSADEAFDKIKTYRPEVVFLDIKMPVKSGFDLLRMFDVIDFEVIFVSAFNEYAITAFEFNALGYILKPIDYTKLVKVVDKAVSKIQSSLPNEKVLHFIKSLDEKNEFIRKMSFHQGSKVVLLDIEDIEYIEADKECCEINTIAKERYSSSKDLKMFEEILKVTGRFIRISKSVVINTSCIKSYTKGEICIIKLETGHEFEISRRKKAEILNIIAE